MSDKQAEEWKEVDGFEGLYEVSNFGRVKSVSRYVKNGLTEKKINEKKNVTRVKIVNEKGETAIGKPIGNYITIDIKKIKLAEEDEIQKASEIVSEELKNIINKHISYKDDILVVGLGNLYVTPDSLGPKVINDIDITRHIIKY